MNLKVYTDHAGGFDVYSGEDVTCWRDGGVLVVEDIVDDRDVQITYGPNGWTRVESDEPVKIDVPRYEVEITRFPEVEITSFPDHHLNVWLDNEPLRVTEMPEQVDKWRH